MTPSLTPCGGAGLQQWDPNLWAQHSGWYPPLTLLKWVLGEVLTVSMMMEWKTSPGRGQGLTYSQDICLGQREIKCWSLLSHENPCADLMRGDGGEGGGGRCPSLVPDGARL